jgi:MoxR-like ATPase
VSTFRLVAAMNPSDGVGTGRITPALYDRSCRVAFDHQSAEEELAIVERGSADEHAEAFAQRAVEAVRATRSHPDLRLGSSVRGALDLVALASSLAALRGEAQPSEDTGADAARAALTGRVALVEGSPRTVEEVVTAIWAATAPRPDDAAEPGSGAPEGDAAGKA